jgi:hypothetical protein
MGNRTWRYLKKGWVKSMNDYHLMIENYLQLLKQRYKKGRLQAKEYRKRMELIHLWHIRGLVKVSKE